MKTDPALAKPDHRPVSPTEALHYCLGVSARVTAVRGVHKLFSGA